MNCFPMLEKIGSPRDLQGLTIEQLTELAAEIRHAICEQVSRSGGHYEASGHLPAQPRAAPGDYCHLTREIKSLQHGARPPPKMPRSSLDQSISGA